MNLKRLNIILTLLFYHIVIGRTAIIAQKIKVLKHLETTSSIFIYSCATKANLNNYTPILGTIFTNEATKFWSTQDLNNNCDSFISETFNFFAQDLTDYNNVILKFEYNNIGINHGYKPFYTLTLNNKNQITKELQISDSSFSPLKWIIESRTFLSTTENYKQVGIDNILLSNNLTPSPKISSVSNSVNTTDNTATANLNFTKQPIKEITGLDASNFTASKKTSNFALIRKKTSFNLNFNPCDLGYRATKLRIANNVINTNLNTFNIQNNGISTTNSCLSESFTDATFAPTFWTSSGVIRSINTADYHSAPAAVSFNSFVGVLTTQAVSFPTAMQFYLGRSGNTTAKTLNVNVSTVSQTGPFTTVKIYNHTNVPAASYNEYTVDLSAYTNEPNVWIQFEKASSTKSPWRLDDINVNCVTNCSPTQTISGFAPTTGPIGTDVIISGTGFTPTATVSINGVLATIKSQTSTEIIIDIPNGATSGLVTINNSGCTLATSLPFTLLKTNGSCTNNFLDLIISEVYDAQLGNGWHMELYNPTNNPINLEAIGSDYGLQRYGSINATTPTRTIDLSGIVPPNSTYILNIGSSNGSVCINNFNFSEFGTGINQEDKIILTKNGVDLDTVHCPNETGFTITRHTLSSGPNTTYISTDWTTISNESCVSLGNFNTTASIFPNISLQPVDVDTCDDTASFYINATPGNSGTLTYQWFYNNGINSNWNLVTNSSFFLISVFGETTNTLLLNGPVNILSGFQFYCQVVEDGNCSIFSNASSLKTQFTIWNGTNWDNGVPLNTSAAIINGNYNTAINGSFTACNLTIDNLSVLTIEDNTYIEIHNNIINKGQLIVKNKGSVVQVNDSGMYTDANSNNINPTIVEKLTAPLNNWYEYTYWSSPVVDAQIGVSLNQASSYRRFWFKAENYVDSYYENNNDNTQTYGPAVDGIDDNNDVWQLAPSASIMTPGVGYIASHSISAMGNAGDTYLYDFRGNLNTGNIHTAVKRNDTEILDNNWNLIVNPYASAIAVDAFFTANVFGTAANGSIESEIYLWTHSTPPSAITNGNEQYNFNASDYAIINASGAIAGGDLNNDGIIDALDIPERFIPSCQSFFVKYAQGASSTSGNVVFNNSMRSTGNNSQFFRISNVNKPNRLWLNLSSNFGVYNQSLIAYINGATTGLDHNSFDTKKNGLHKSSIGFYSIVDENNEKLCIQGKNPSDLNIDEVVKLGFKNAITIPTIFTLKIDQLQGEFLMNNPIYLKDNYLNTYTNLSNSNYSFTSEVGEFTDRFEIVFKVESLSTEVFSAETTHITMVELDNDIINFKTHSNTKIKTIVIYNTLGQRIYSKKLINSWSHNATLNNFSNSMYVAKILLNNGKKIVKKGIKK